MKVQHFLAFIGVFAVYTVLVMMTRCQSPKPLPQPSIAVSQPNNSGPVQESKRTYLKKFKSNEEDDIPGKTVTAGGFIPGKIQSTVSPKGKVKYHPDTHGPKVVKTSHGMGEYTEYSNHGKNKTTLRNVVDTAKKGPPLKKTQSLKTKENLSLKEPNHAISKTICINFSLPFIQNLRSGKVKPSIKPRTIYYRSSGRLGNAMFQVAGIFALANATGSRVVVTPGNGLFNHPFKAFKFFDIGWPPNDTSMAVFKMRHQTTEYMSAIRAALSQDIQLQHFYQQLQFFEGCLDAIRSLFIFKDSVSNKARSFIESDVLKERQRNESTIVGIHVRRGDIMNAYYYSEGYRVPGLSYFKNAMDYFRNKYSNVIFVVATNDKEWVQENMVGKDIVYSGLTSPGEDLALLSLCDHVIQSIGTFSWWAGFLCKGETVYYKDWIVKDSYIYKKFQYKPRSRFLPSWIPMR